jgi:hypothetical protein
MLENNPQIDTLLLCFWYAPLRQELVDNFTDKTCFSMNNVMYHMDLFGVDELLALNNKEELFFYMVNKAMKDVFSLIKHYIEYKNFTYDYLQIGGYYKLDRQMLQKDIEKSRRKNIWYNFTSTSGDESVLQKDYLLKIVNLCKERNVKLVLINPPMYKPEVYGHLDKLEAYRQKYLKDVAYLDYSGFKFPSDSYYGDIGHINYKGAAIFSQYLQEHFGQK